MRQGFINLQHHAVGVNCATILISIQYRLNKKQYARKHQQCQSITLFSMYFLFSQWRQTLVGFTEKPTVYKLRGPKCEGGTHEPFLFWGGTHMGRFFIWGGVLQRLDVLPVHSCHENFSEIGQDSTHYLNNKKNRLFDQKLFIKFYCIFQEPVVQKRS